MTGLPVFLNKKSKTYDLILVIINWLIKIVYYKLLKVIINALDLVQIIIDIILRYYNFLNLIITN